MRSKTTLRDYVVEKNLVYAVRLPNSTIHDPGFLHEGCEAIGAIRADHRIGENTSEMMNNSTDLEWMKMLEGGMAADLCGNFDPGKKGTLGAEDLFGLLPLRRSTDWGCVWTMVFLPNGDMWHQVSNATANTGGINNRIEDMMRRDESKPTSGQYPIVQAVILNKATVKHPSLRGTCCVCREGST